MARYATSLILRGGAPVVEAEPAKGISILRSTWHGGHTKPNTLHECFGLNSLGPLRLATNSPTALNRAVPGKT